MEENKDVQTEQVEEVVEEQKETAAVETTPKKETNNAHKDDVLDEEDEEILSNLAKFAKKKELRNVKSILRDKGFDEDSVKEYSEKYVARQNKEYKAKDDKIEELTNQNAELNKKLLKLTMNAAAAKVAAELGVKSNKVQYLLRMADTTNAINQGNVNEDELKKSFESVLTDLPELKETVEKAVPQVKKIGTTTTETKQVNQLENMRKQLGLK